MSQTLTYIRLNLARLLVIIGTLSALGTWYFSIPIVDDIFNTMNVWNVNIGIFTLFTGLFTIFIRYIRSIQKRDSDVWYFQAYALILIIVWVIFGFTSGMYSDIYQVAFLSTKLTLHIAILGQVIFYYVSGAYRTFRIKTLRTGVLALSAIIIVILNAPWMQNPFPVAQDLSFWLLDNPQMAASRAMVITGGIGTIVLGIRVVLGLEKGIQRITEG
jgi:hypothetical protein